MKPLKTLTLSAILIASILINGCQKELVTSPIVKKNQPNDSVTSGKMVLVPYRGFVPIEQVHAILPGNHLELRDGHYLQVETKTNKVIDDWGVITNNKLVSGQTNSPTNKSDMALNPTGISPNWIVFGTWTNPTNSPISSFSTSYKVPTAPHAFNGQDIFIYNGLQDASQTSILQPVLQFGYSAAGGGNLWSITNWYVASSFVAYAPVTTVAAGTNLTGVMNYTGQQSVTASYNYTSAFSGYPNNTITVIDGNKSPNNKNVKYPLVSQLVNAVETLEAYNSDANQSSPPPTSVSQYPPDNFIKMISSLQTVAGLSGYSFSPVNNNPSFGQQALVVNSTEVDLYFNNLVPALSYPTPNTFTEGTAITALSPTNTGGTPTSYSCPNLPAGLSISATTGVISGTPSAGSAATNYTVTATDAAGSINTTVNIAVTATGPYTFGIETDKTATTYFAIVVNGVNISGNGRGTAPPGQVNNIQNTNVILSTNSTIVFQVTSGYMPTSATIYTSGQAPINSVISGANITFSGVNLTLATSSTIYLY